MNRAGQEGEDPGIPSPFAGMFRPRVIKHLDINVNERGHRSPFLNHMSSLGLFLVGWGAVWAFSAFPPGSPSDIAGTIALAAWMMAACEAITEHSHNAAQKKSQRSVEALIKEAIDHFNKS